MIQFRSASSLIALTLAISGYGPFGAGGSGEGLAVVPAPSSTPALSPTSIPNPTPAPAGSIALSGDVSPVHDPAIIKDGGTYYLFVTGSRNSRAGMLAVRTSTDLADWTLRGPVYKQLSAWATAAVPGTSGIWAPDIVKRSGEYRLYYSVSTFGKNRSAIGLTTAAALNAATPDAGWTDKGAVIQSSAADDYNAIDPNIFDDPQGRQWMAFGSFWSGIKLIELDPATGLRLAGDTAVRSLASRPSPGAIEAPFVIRRGGYYYLFASFDFCCRGARSTYSTVVGRSTDPTGPYVDRDGKPMMKGGGSLVLASGVGAGGRFVGRGHVAVLQDGERDLIVYHAYDTERNGTPTLRIQPLAWTGDGWPVAR